eukprot:scaffold2493_cov62-Phaeocystis_antarctica.AAC.9
MRLHLSTLTSRVACLHQAAHPSTRRVPHPEAAAPYPVPGSMQPTPPALSMPDPPSVQPDLP